MKKTLTLLVFALLCLNASALTSNFVATVTIINGTANGNSITVGSDVRVFTNSVFIPASQVLTNVTVAGSLVNLLNEVSDFPFTGLSLYGDGISVMKLTTLVNVTRPTITLSSGWATLTWHTNYFGTGTSVRVPYESEPDLGKQTNVWSEVARGLVISTNPITLHTGKTNSFDHTIFTDPSTNQLLFMRSDGLVFGTTLPSTLSIPILSWFTNNVADGVTLTGASFEAITNSGSGWAFTDAITNCIRSRIPMPWDWDGSNVLVEIQALCTGTNSGPGGATNVVFAVRGAANGAGSAANLPTFGTAVWTTNHFGIGAYTNYVAITSPVTIGGGPSAGKSVLWEIQRLGAQSGDTVTNVDTCITEVKIHYNRFPIVSLPTSTP
jgi:hypothetical protein